MPRTIPLAVLTASCLFAQTLSPAPARADGPNCTDDICARWAEPTGTVCRIAGTSIINGGNRLEGQFRITRDLLDIGTTFDRERPDGCFTARRPYALQGFVLFMGNHSVDRLRVEQSPGQYVGAIRDGDGRDLASGVIWATPLPRTTPIRIAEFDNCAFSCRFDLSSASDTPLPQGTPVILGFNLNRDGGDGGHLREMMIDVGPGPTLEVRYGEPDWSFSSRVQIGWIDESILAAADQEASFDYRGHDGEERPTPPGRIHPDLLAQAAFPQFDHALQAFHMRFGNGGHFLGYIGIERDGDVYEAWAQDEQPDADFRFPDDPFAMSARYAVIRPFVEAIDGAVDFGRVMVME